MLHRASATRSSSVDSERGERLDIIVHPHFRHTLPKHAAAPPPRHWDKLPIEVRVRWWLWGWGWCVCMGREEGWRGSPPFGTILPSSP